MIKSLVATVIFCVVAATIIVVEILYSPMPVALQSNSVLVIDKNITARSLVANLKNKKLIKHDKIVLAYIKIFGISKFLKAGVFQVQAQESVANLLKRIVAFDVIKKSIQITPGTTNAQLSKNLTSAEYLEYSDSSWLTAFSKNSNFLEICKYDSSCIDILKHPKSLQNYEGLYLADTYQYNAGSDAEKILFVAHLNLKKCLLKSWDERDLILPYKNPYELLIVASILEKESAIQEDKRLISGVIVNRLKKNMPLQVDPTVIYALQNKYTGKLSHSDMQIASKYNTYKNKGLPPTPIAIVSCDSIKAASHPIVTDYLYFVAKGDGKHIFSTNYDEHRKFIRASIH